MEAYRILLTDVQSIQQFRRIYGSYFTFQVTLMTMRGALVGIMETKRGAIAGELLLAKRRGDLSQTSMATMGVLASDSWRRSETT